MSAFTRPSLAMILAGSAVACGGGSPTAPTWDGQVRVAGSVLDFRTNAAIAGASVRIGNATATTDPGGRYSLTVPVSEQRVSIDDESIGLVYLKDPTYRGDFYAHVTGCVARYGIVLDSRTRRPISGATVTVGGVSGATDPSGWFRVNLGCPGVSCIGFNTTFLYISHPNYANGSFIAGRGVCFVQRVDYELMRR